MEFIFNGKCSICFERMTLVKHFDMNSFCDVPLKTSARALHVHVCELQGSQTLMQ